MYAQTNRHTLQLALCGGGGCGGIIIYYIFIYLQLALYLHYHGKLQLALYIYIGQLNGVTQGYCFRTLKIIFVAISPSFIRAKFDKKYVFPARDSYNYHNN